MRWLLVTALALAGAATQEQEKGGKIPWNHDPEAAVAKSKETGLPMMLYFTSKG